MKTLVQKMISTESSISPLVLRIALLTVLWPHGAQLLFGAFGGAGYSGSMVYFQSQGLPYLIAFTVIFLLFFGPLFLLFGFCTRLISVGIFCLFVGMIVVVHLPFGFFMNWYGAQRGEGFEFHLLVLGATLALIVSGSGNCSIDAAIYKAIVKNNLS